MTELVYVKIENHCTERIKVNIRYPRPKKKSKSLPKSFNLEPRQSSHPLPRNFLVGARGWDRLESLDCVDIKTVKYEPRFVQIDNLTEDLVTLNVVPTPKVPIRKKTKLTIEAGKKSRSVDIHSISQRSKLRKLVKTGKVRLAPIYAIGPSTGRGKAVASYAHEDVYICYKCGGPIVFRGDPPMPVHI
jgi:hypothetical protein